MLVVMALEAAELSDSQNKIATGASKYQQRLKKLTDKHLKQDGYLFNFKVYEAAEINAFAMADGTIRMYSGLMDMMDDAELVFVIGHEMGHVVKEHIRKKIRLSYATLGRNHSFLSSHPAPDKRAERLALKLQ